MIVARLFNTSGPRQLGNYGMVLPTFVRQALRGDDLTVFGDGTQTRCFAHVDDVVRGMIDLIGHDGALGRPFNIGAGAEISMNELAEKVIDRVGSTSAITTIPFDQAYGDGFEDIGRRRPDTTALTELTGWRAERSVDDAIDDVIAYERIRAATDPSARPASIVG